MNTLNSLSKNSGAKHRNQLQLIRMTLKSITVTGVLYALDRVHLHLRVSAG